MRFLVDANLSPVVAAALRDAGHDSVHVIDLGLFTADDDRILDEAAHDDRVILTADADFGATLRRRIKLGAGKAPGLAGYVGRTTSRQKCLSVQGLT